MVLMRGHYKCFYGNIQNLNNKILQDIYGQFKYENSVFECNGNWSNFQNIVENIEHV